MFPHAWQIDSACVQTVFGCFLFTFRLSLLIIEKCISNLNPGGIVIIRDGDKDKEEQHKKTRLTEFFSTRLFNFNKTKETGLSFLSGKMIREIAVEKRMHCSEIPDSKLTSNTIFILKAAAN